MRGSRTVLLARPRCPRFGSLSDAPLPAPACAGFGGRLFNQIRSREGLAYSVSGGWSATPIDHPGLFIATAETAQPAALLAALRGALEEAVAVPPPAQELQRAKQVGCGCPGVACKWDEMAGTSGACLHARLPGGRGPGLLPLLLQAPASLRGQCTPLSWGLFPPRATSPWLRRRAWRALCSTFPRAPPSCTAPSPLTCWASPRTTCSGGLGLFVPVLYFVL